MLTEYLNEVKSGFMRIKLKSDFTESVNNDDEVVFTGFDFRFISAYYEMDSSVPEYIAHAVAVD